VIVGIGVDIVEIKRLREVLERQQDRFIRRVFTEVEQEFCVAHRDPVPHYAARFAAKESLFKALGTGWAKGVSWKDAEVVRAAMQAPRLALHGQAEKLSQALGVNAVHLSLSHSNDSAVAVVILEHQGHPESPLQKL
jgi:holo-[acyl-carrier protein] synthase